MLSLFEHIFLIILYSPCCKSNSFVLFFNLHPDVQNRVWEDFTGVLVTPSGLPVAIVLNLPEEICRDRNLTRSDRQFGQHVIKRHVQNIRRSLKGLHREGFRQVYILNSLEQIAAVEITRELLWNNKKHEHGPFDTPLLSLWTEREIW